eukprot:3474925-Alexandrium_andersonii.AAC.1
MVHVSVVTVPTDLTDLPGALAVGEALGCVSSRVRRLLRAQLRRVAGPLTIAANSGRRPCRGGAHMPGINGSERVLGRRL